MSKNIYEMLNEVEVKIDEVKKEDFTDLEKFQIKKKFRNSIKKKKSYKKYVAVASVLLVSVTLLNKEVVSYAKEIIDDITYTISRALGISTDLEEYTNIINKSISKNGIDISIKEVILNNDEIIFTYSVKSDKKLEEIGSPSFTPKSILVNDKEIGALGGGGGTKIDEYAEEHVSSFRLFGIEKYELKGNVDFKISFDEGYIDEDNAIKGPWVFEFRANGESLAIDTEEIKIDKSYKLDNGVTLIIDKYTRNDLGELIYTKLEGMNPNKSYEVYFKGLDDSGDAIKFMITNSSYDEPIFAREDISLKLDAKNTKIDIYMAEIDGYEIANSEDFKLVVEGFVIE